MMYRHAVPENVESMYVFVSLVVPGNITFATKPEIVLEQMRKANLYPG